MQNLKKLFMATRHTLNIKSQKLRSGFYILYKLYFFGFYQIH